MSVSTVSSSITILATMPTMVCIGRSDLLDFREVPDGVCGIWLTANALEGQG